MANGNVMDEIVIKQAEELIEDLESPDQQSQTMYCKNHGTVVKAQALTLKLLIPLYRQKRNGEQRNTGAWSFLSKTPLAMLSGSVPPSVLLFLYFIGRGRGWW
jgi:hypothetical protein